ncbi:MAG: soluble lytic murein transglycosylase, partial [Pseudomonadota bacterium]
GMVKNICSRYRRSMLYPQAKTSQASSALGLWGGIGQPRSHMGLIAALIVGGLATASAGVLAKPKADTTGQHPVIQAKNAFQSRNLAAIAQAERALANDPLRIWPEYWRQQLLVSGQPFSDQARLAITQFAQQHKDHHLVRALQRDWGVAALQSGPWGPQTRSVLEQIPRDLAHAGLQCAFARLNPAMPVSDRLLIVHGNEIARGCQGLLEEMAQSGALDESNLRTKARAMASLGEVAAAERLWSSFKRQGALSASEKATLSILSLSSRNSLQAATRFQKERSKLSVEQATFLEFNIGSRLWMRTDPRAGAMVQRGMPSLPHQPPLIQEAAARVSLRMGDWDNLRQILGAMPPSLRNQDHWAYWQGWLASQAGQTRKAKEIWAGIPPGWGFYQILAAEALGRPLTTPPLDDGMRQRVRQYREQIADHPSLYRGLKLSALGLRAEASLEWNAFLTGLSDPAILAASELALEAGQPDRAIAAAIRTQDHHDLQLRYPVLFRPEIDKANRAELLETAWVLGLMRQESRFLQAVRSPVGAVGLMQLMPQTAKSVARDIGLKGFQLRALEEPQVNISLGVRYLQDLANDFNGSAVLATAAYNAGPGRSRLWRSNLSRSIPGAAFAESIPFTETRTYVKQVLANTVVYQQILSQDATLSRAGMKGEAQRVRLNDWLAQVGPTGLPR